LKLIQPSIQKKNLVPIVEKILEAFQTGEPDILVDLSTPGTGMAYGYAEKVKIRKPTDK